MAEDSSRAWLCTVCGYVHQGDEPPDVCPVCGAPASDFKVHVEPADAGVAADPRQWRCLNCNYVQDGPEPPDTCPICGVGSDRFEGIAVPVSSSRGDDALNIVVIGGGIAGVAAAQAARETSPASSVTLICRESMSPYYRLNLTRYLAGDIGRDALPVYPNDWYDKAGINLETSVSVERLLPADRIIELKGGARVPYDRLVLAMGAHAFVPPIPGRERKGVITLRTASDAERILDRVRTNPACIVVGGGILGIETAGALAARGADVTLLESHEWLMPRQLNRKAADRLEACVTETGVRVRKAVRTREILGNAHVTGIVLSDGSRLEASTVVLATGVRPDTYLARKAGLEVDSGVIVNNRLQTSDPFIYAAGDVAEHNGCTYGTWAPSQFQGRIAGLNAAGASMEFGGLPRSNVLKVLGLDMMSLGQFEPEDGSYVVLQHEEEASFAHFVFRDGKMVGSILVGYPSLGTPVKDAVEGRRDFSRHVAQAGSGLDIVQVLSGEVPAEEKKKTQTEKGGRNMATMDNLQESFAGESQANRKYLAFAKKAEQDGYAQVAKLFRAAAEAETVHAHAHFRVMGGINDTASNLAAAIEGEGFEFQQMYPKFLAESQAEGNKGAEVSFKNALAVEEIHHGMYSAAAEAVKAGNDLPATKIFVCSVCGNTVEGDAPDTCPVCNVSKDKFFEVA